MYIFFKNKYIKNLIFNIFNYLNEGRIIMAKFKNVYLKLISEMNENIVSLLGGRVAEKLVLDDISTGASNDIERASKIARAMVMKYGMSEKLGPITFGSTQEEVFLGKEMTSQRDYSERVASEIDDEVKDIITRAYNYAERILKENIDKLHKVAQVLIEKEKIESDEFDAIFAG